MLFSVASGLAQQQQVAYYPFNGEASDASGLNNHGQLVGGVTPTHDRFGQPCSALQFDGVSGFIEVPTSPSLESPLQSITICLWYKLTPVATSNLWLTAVCKGAYMHETPENPQYRLQAQQNLAVVPNTCSPTTPSASSTISLNSPFTECDSDFSQHLFDPGTWHFYALIYDGSMVRVYMDDLLVFEYPFSDLLEPNSFPLFIGKDEPGVTEYFNGSMDDLRIFNYALSRSETARLYAQKGKVIQLNDFEVRPLPNRYIQTDPSQCAVKLTYAPPVAQSNCGNVLVTQLEGLPSGSMFPVGTHRIRYQVTAPSGYVEVLTSYIEVRDNIPPILKVPADTVVMISADKTGELVNYAFPTATDNCGIKSISISKGAGPGSFFDEGRHLIAFRAVDYSDNVTDASFYLDIKKVAPTKAPEKPATVLTTTPKDTTVFKDTTAIQPPVYVPDTLSSSIYKGNNILFLLDVSQSMSENQKFNLLKDAMSYLVPRLRTFDRMTVLTYAADVQLFYPPSPLTDKASFLDKINSIVPGGSTAADKAITKAYEVLSNNYIDGLNTAIYLVTDGLFELSKNDRALVKYHALSAQRPINLNVVAIKPSSDAAIQLEKVAKESKGTFVLLRTKEDAEKKILDHIKAKSKK